MGSETEKKKSIAGILEWLRSGYNGLKAAAAAVAVVASLFGAASYVATVDDVRAAEERVSKKIDLTLDALRLKILGDQIVQYDLILRKNPADSVAREQKCKIEKEKEEILDRMLEETREKGK